MAAITGWGRGTWSQGPWDAPIPVIVTGEAATGAVGSVTVIGVANVPVVGLAVTGGVGSVVVTADANVNVTGETATGGVGSVVVTADAVVEPTGLAGTGGVGSVTVVADALVQPTGVAATGNVGSVTVVAEANISVTGLAATGEIGTVAVAAAANVPVTGLEAAGAVGTVTVSANANVQPSGVSASASLPVPIAFSGVGDAQISTAQSKFGGASLLLDGSGDYLESQETYNFANDPFTIDMWVRPANGTQDAIFFDSRDSTSNNALALRQASDNLLVLRGNGTLFNINSVFSADTWVHIAVTRGDPFGNTYRVFVNGVEADSLLFGLTASAATIHIGSDFNGSNNWAGYIDELRVSSVDRYGETDFTPPTSAYTADDNTPVLLHFDGANGSTTFTNDGIVEAVTVTGAANVFPTGIAATGELGDVEVGIRVIVPVTGLESTGNVGSVVVVADSNVSVTGLNATGEVGAVFVWSEIDPNQNPNWTGVSPSQSPSWSEETPSQVPGWTDIAA
jgi:hypothetical protein